jgi:acetyl esterase
MDNLAATFVEQPLEGRLAPSAKALLEQIVPGGFPGWSSWGLEASRAAILQMSSLLGGQPEPVARVEAVTVPGPDGSGIEGHLYIPNSPAPLPVLVYLHGGGWALGNHTCVDSLARMLANRSGCAILSMDYRLAPENKYPAALNDVFQTLEWAAANAPNVGLDPHRIGVGGDSSGANLATAVSLLCRNRGGPPLALQLLVYPVVDHNYDNQSHQRFGDPSLSALGRADVIWFHQLYANTPEDLDEPCLSPLRAKSLAGLPRTLLVAAEIDPLFQEGLEYSQRLAQEGVPVERKVYPGMFHGFWRMPGALSEAREAIEYAAARMREVMQAERETGSA